MFRTTNSTIWTNLAKNNTEFKATFFLEQFEKLLPTTAKILDYGCGYGRNLDLLYKKGYENVYGVDYSDGMIDRCKTTYPHLADKVHCNKDEKSSPLLEAHSFDAVVLFSVLTCNPLDKDQDNLIHEIKRVLKPGGILYLNDYLLSEHEERKSHYKKAQSDSPSTPYGVFTMRHGSGVCRHFSKERLNNLLSEFEPKWFLNKDIPTIGGPLDNSFQMIGIFHPGESYKLFPEMEPKEDTLRRSL